MAAAELGCRKTKNYNPFNGLTLLFQLQLALKKWAIALHHLAV